MTKTRNAVVDSLQRCEISESTKNKNNKNGNLEPLLEL
jgi:hypothetical protein